MNEFVLRKAKESRNQKVLKELKKTWVYPTTMKYLGVQRKWLEKFGSPMIGIAAYAYQE
jgi:hypothetical protein